MTTAVLFLEQLFLADVLERYFSRRFIATLELLIYGAAIYSFSIFSDLYALTVLFVVQGIGLGIINPSMEAIWVDITKVEERGRIYGMRIAFFDFGQLCWTILIPFIMIINPLLPFYTIASATLLSVALLFLALRKS